MERLTNIGGGFEEELWNRKQTADFLGISQQTLAKLVLEERIPAQRSGRKYHFLKSQVVDYLKGKNNELTDGYFVVLGAAKSSAQRRSN